MAIDNKIFTGGLNSDDEDRLMPNGDYRYALNVHNSKSDSDSYGAIENVKGNAVTSVFLGAGNFKCVGAYDDKLNNKVYWFIWNDLDGHLIMEFDVVANTTAIVMFGGALNFRSDKLIIEQNVAIIDGLMYFNDTYNPPRKINIAKEKTFALSGTGGGVGGLDPINIQAVKAAPHNPPTLKYGSNVNIKTNNVRGKLFQFRYKFVYSDNEESAWSPISKTVIPNIDDVYTLAQNENKYRPFSYYETYLNNYIKVSLVLSPTEHPLATRIKIAFREQNVGDFYLAEDKKIIDITTLPNFEFDFYNNESYISIDNDGNKGMRLFDGVPLLSNTQSLIDGNIITYGGITEGYDPIDVDMVATPKYTTNQIEPAADFDSTLGTQIAFYAQHGVNASLFLQYSLIDSASPPLAGILVNGNPVILYGTGNISAVSAIGTQVYFLNAPVGNNSIVTTERLKVEMRIGNNNIADGVRYTVRLKIKYFDYGTGTIVDWNPSVQITANATDTAFDLAFNIKSALMALTLDTGVMTVSFDNFQIGAWSIALGGLTGGVGSGLWTGGTVPTGDVVLLFNVIGRLKLLSFPVVSPTPLGIPTFGVGGSSGILYDSDVNFGSGFPPVFPNSSNSIQIPIAGSLISVEPEIKLYADWTLITEKSLKNGANHGVGLVYYDFANRSGLTNRTKEKLFYVPYPSERTSIPNGSFLSSTDLELTIKHLPPSWATHYQVVYTGNQTIENIQNSTGYKGFIQFKINDYNPSSGITGAVTCKIDELNLFNDQTPESVDIGYGYSKGDRIRFLMDASGNYLTQYIDVEIIKYDLGVLTFKKPNATVGNDYTVEIYTPKKQIDDTFYYEVGEVRRVTNGFHEGDTQNQDAVNDAVLLLTDIGDVYMRYRVAPTSRQIEDYHYSDYYKSDSWDKGRPNIVDNNIKQIYRPTTIRYSQPYIPETNINGLSRFDDFDFEAYDHQYGDIRLLYSSDRLLNVFQRLKVGRIGISQSTIYSADGSSAAVSRVDKVLNEIIYHAGEYGIGDNPESFAVYGNSKYFVDVKRGLVCRLGGDGITPISEYKMHNYFTDMFEALDTNSLPYKVIGTYDVRFDEYIIHITNGTIQETVAFSEGKNRWVSFYSYFPEYMITNRTGLISFFAGQLYRHNMNNLYNTFYGNYVSSKLRFISNVEPLKVKVFTNITQDTNSVFRIEKATNKNGQETNLEYTDFEDVEGVYKATLLKDINTPNIAEPLIEGDEMRDTFLDITIENESTDFVKLLSVGVGVTLSESTNR